MRTPTPEIGRKKKAGLLGRPGRTTGSSRGTPGPDAGYALTLAARSLHGVTLSTGESLHDLEMGIALLAATRAGRNGRGPTLSDVEVAMDLFELRATPTDDVIADRRQRFAGLAHSYVAQRAFIDGVDHEVLAQTPGSVVALRHFHR